MKKEALIVLALIVFAGAAIAEMALLERFEGPGVLEKLLGLHPCRECFSK